MWHYKFAIEVLCDEEIDEISLARILLGKRRGEFVVRTRGMSKEHLNAEQGMRLLEVFKDDAIL